MGKRRRAGSRKHAASGVEANVLVDVTVRPTWRAKTVVTVVLEIRATNRTDTPIPLKDPYVLPNRQAQNVSALDDEGELPPPIGFSDGYTGISFGNRPAIAPSETYEWVTTWDWVCDDALDDDFLLFEYVIPPQEIFQGRRVHWHAFECWFRFDEPPGGFSRFMKQYRIRTRDNQGLKYEPSGGWRVAVYHIPRFVVTKDTVRIQFACFYEFPRRWVKVALASSSVLATAIIGKLADFAVDQGWLRWLPWLH